MKKLKLSLSNFEGTEVLTRQQLKNIVGGGSCYMVYSSQGYQSCWYTNGSPLDLCNRVYGDNCQAHSSGPVNCSSNNCTMN